MDIILIPGFWLDGSSWDEVVPALEQAGHRTHALTLPGMESKDADRSEITLRDHVDAVVGVVDSFDPADGKVVLVGHSGGGAIAHAAVDARPGRVARVVYVDSGPLGEGGVINDELPAEKGEVLLPDWSLFDDEDLVDLDDRLRAAFRERAIPTPVHVTSDPQRLHDERRYDDLGVADRWADLGVADRWADLAIATWNVTVNYGPGWEGLLLDAYGVPLDAARTRYYRLLGRCY